MQTTLINYIISLELQWKSISSQETCALMHSQITFVYFLNLCDNYWNGLKYACQLACYMNYAGKIFLVLFSYSLLFQLDEHKMIPSNWMCYAWDCSLSCWTAVFSLLGCATQETFLIIVILTETCIIIRTEEISNCQVHFINSFVFCSQTLSCMFSFPVFKLKLQFPFYFLTNI